MNLTSFFLLQSRIHQDTLQKVLRCADKLEHPRILYLIWKRVTEENALNAEASMTDVQTEYLKESQFYMACKLVQLYQSKIDDIMNET